MYLCRIGKTKHEKIKKNKNKKTKNNDEFPNRIYRDMALYYLGEINVEEEGLLGVRDLNPILLVGIGDVDVVHSLCYAFHCYLSLTLSR